MASAIKLEPVTERTEREVKRVGDTVEIDEEEEPAVKGRGGIENKVRVQVSETNTLSHSLPPD